MTSRLTRSWHWRTKKIPRISRTGDRAKGPAWQGKQAPAVQARKLLKEFGQLYSSELSIDLGRPFEWLVASVLFGRRISTEIAKKTFFAYREAGLTTPEKIACASWEDLVRVHGRGGYVRYDGITATYMKEIAAKLISEYGGDVRRMDALSKSPAELEARLMELKGVGPITARIYLRELRSVWRNADPEPTDPEVRAAKALGMVTDEGRALEQLKGFWRKNRVPGYSFRNLEAALVRIGLKLRRGARLGRILPWLA